METLNVEGLYEVEMDDTGYYNYYDLEWLAQQQDWVRSQTMAYCQQERDDLYKQVEEVQNALNRDKTLHTASARASQDAILDLELQLAQKKTALAEVREMLADSSRLWEEEREALLAAQEELRSELLLLKGLAEERTTLQEVSKGTTSGTPREPLQESQQGDRRKKKKIWARFINIFHKKTTDH